MPRYIDAEILEQKFTEWHTDLKEKEQTAKTVREAKRTSDIATGVVSCLLELRDTPKADVEPVRHGRWIIEPGCGEYGRCSKCEGKSGTQWDGVEPIPLLTAYCPHCGAKMDEEDNS